TFAVLAVLLVSPASAQASRTWVSGVGSDANPCSRTAPCQTFAGAIVKTAPGGEISVLDPGGFGAVTITKSITINGDGSLASVLVSGTNGIVISAAATDRVIIRNVSFQGLGTGINAIQVLAAGTVILDHVNINGFSGNGINVSLAASGNLFVQDTNITNCADGIRLTTSSGAVLAMLSNVRLEGLTNGLEAAAGGRAMISHSYVSGNSGSGLLASAATSQINAEGCQIAFNNVAGVNASASGAVIRISDNEIYNNTSGVSIAAGATVSSADNNRVAGNSGTTAPNGTAIPIE
ncbi:MAG TPA: right-handed parallel beta-helix repeat-containing protein, partial [Thermoanaerobaculia bacterium]|nr:right-handed parallel beta-helix repeat-containing protein [Thermoanaerobaculia bacterium]